MSASVWGFSGIFIMLAVLTIPLLIIFVIVRLAVNNAQLKRTLENDIRMLRNDINRLAEIIHRRE